MRHTLAATLLLTALATTGCYVDTTKHGDDENVKIATPFGGMQVKTNEADILTGIGLPAYPGATLVKKEKGNGKDNDNDGAADVNMSFGSFQLKVKATSYRTSDKPEKVLAFYRKVLGSRFGTVIQCSGDEPVGTPTRTAEGLTCDDDHDHGHHAHTGKDSDSKYQLKAGSQKHQHIVDINSDGTGTRFGLVSLDLPLDFNFGSNKDDHDDKDDNKGGDKPQ